MPKLLEAMREMDLFIHTVVFHCNTDQATKSSLKQIATSDKYYEHMKSDCFLVHRSSGSFTF